MELQFRLERSPICPGPVWAPPHFWGRCLCLGGNFRFKFIKGGVAELCFFVGPWSWTHQDAVQELQTVSVSLGCSDGMGSVVSGHKEYWAWGSGGLIKRQESSEMVVCPSLQPDFGSLLKPRKEWSVAAAPFHNPPATPAHTSCLEQVGQVQASLAPGKGWKFSSQSMQCQILAPRLGKNWAGASTLETRALTLTSGHPPAE